MLRWNVTTSPSGRKALIRVEGELDLYGAPAFAKAVLAGVEGGWSRLCLDLSALEYLDSTGVGAIIRVLQALRKKGGSLVSRGIQGSPRKVLELSNIIVLLGEEKNQEGNP